MEALRFKDLFSNVKSFQSIGVAKSEDKNPPAVKSFTLLPPEVNFLTRRLAINIEFDEFVVDSFDTEQGSLYSDGIAYGRKVILNGDKSAITEWKPSKDHHSAKLLIHESSKAIKNRENNVIEFQLTDVFGNSDTVKIELILDIQEPKILPIAKDGPSCEMASVKSFRCRVSDDDTKEAILQPLSFWPTSSYQTKTSTEVRGDETFHWIYFETYEAMPEKDVSNIIVSDVYGNNSVQLFRYLNFRTVTEVPQFKENIVSSTQLLEVIFSQAIEGIDEVLVDGTRVEFSLTTLNPFGVNSLKTALIQFKSPLTLGTHTVVLKGVSRKGNIFAKLDSQKIDVNITNLPQFVFASFSDDKVIAAQDEFRFEATGLIKAEELKVFALIDISNKSLLTDIQFTNEGVTDRGTYQYKIKKSSASNLWKNRDRQFLSFQIGEGKESQTAFVNWSTQEPEFIIKSKKVPSQLTVEATRSIDLASLEIELVSGGKVTAIHKAWITPDLLDSKTFTITFPDSISITENNTILRVRSAVTTTFKIPMSQPFEMLISGE